MRQEGVSLEIQFRKAEYDVSDRHLTIWPSVLEKCFSTALQYKCIHMIFKAMRLNKIIKRVIIDKEERRSKHRALGLSGMKR